MCKENFKTAVILAGGKSSRMGFDKQFLEIDEVRIMEKLIQELRKEFDDIVVVTNKKREYEEDGFRVISDEIKGVGPLSGIHIGLKESKSKYTYFIACDMPNISLKYIRYMKKVLLENKYDACVAKIDDKVEPFNSFYSKDILPKIESLINKEKRSMFGLINIIETLFIEKNILEKYNYDFDMFINLNSKEDLEMYNKRNRLEEKNV